MDIKSIRENNKDFLSYNHRGYNVSQEYTAVDWPNFFLGKVNTIWRQLTSSTQTTVDHPGLIVALFLSKKAKVVDALKLFNSYEILTQIVGLIRGKKNSLAYGFDKSILNGAPNAYTVFFVDYKKLKNYTKDEADIVIKEFKQAVNALKSFACKKIPRRTLTSSEVSDIKKFRPDLAEREMKTALRWIEQNNPAIYKTVNELAAWITTNMLRYLQDGILED